MASRAKRKRLLLLMMMMLEEEMPVTYERRMWARQRLLRREERGAFNTLAVEDTPGFNEYMRMPYPKFVALADLIGPHIKKQNTCMRISIPASERLALTIRFLATGETFQSLSFQFRIGKATVSGIVTEVCDAIYAVLGQDFLQTPKQAEKWTEIAELFNSRWNIPRNIPNNIGAIDGKRILIQKPAYEGSHFHDYKGNESIIALVVSGPDYECLYVDVGTNGRNPDGHAWGRSFLKYALNDSDNPLNIPPPRPLPGRTTPVPFVLTGDEAFGLSKYMLKPYPSRNLTVEQRITNYRISRGRRISKNILGILGNRWRCFRVPFLLAPCKVKGITLAALTLHNWLRADTSSRNIYSPPTLVDREDPEMAEVIPGSWREDIPTDSFLNLQPSTSRNCSNEAKNMREEFTQWFNNEGDVSWQRHMYGL